MPAADELFRPTGAGHGASGITGPALSTVGSAARAARPGTDRLRAVPDPVEEEPGYEAEGYPPGYEEAGAQDQQSRPARVRSTPRPRGTAARGASGRERHDEKITVYVSPEELLALEQARIMLRAQHGLAVDRGRIVREAIDLVLADFDRNGESSLLVETLRGH
ncbi:MAG TPA: cobyrinic acid a,c-diamide synthase [Actinocrinis sp.]|nr:cobyrinic acid a,c-diamide synthase [Actinocrinis sp.]